MIRTLALALIVLALANPSFTREDRDPLSSIAVVVVDKSPSQNFGDRTQQTEAARAAVVERLSKIPGLEVRTVEAGQADGETDGTRLFTALGSTLADVPTDRIAGVVMITDGRVHDVPADATALGFAAPVHALITGNKDERDRRVALIAAPRFGIVGQPQTITYRVEDQGANEKTAQVTVRRDGDVIDTRTVPVGVPAIRHRPDSARRTKHCRDRSSRRSITNSRWSITARWLRSTACATSSACSWFQANRMPASALGVTFSNPMPRSISSISPFCGRRKNRTARRSTNCR